MPTIKHLAALVAVVVASAGWSMAHAQQATPSPAVPAVAKYKSAKLNRAQLDELLAKPEQLQIIDVRRPDELTSIGGFPVYLSIQSKDLEKNLEKSLAFIAKDRQIVTVSNHAGRALAAADLLSARGFKVAGAVGAQDYEAEGGSLSKIAAPPPKPAAAK